MTNPPAQSPPPAASPLAKLASHGAIYTAGMLVSRLLSFVMVPVYTHVLGESDYGALEILDTTDLLVIAAFSSPIADPVLRHYTDARTDRDRRAVISTSILALTGVGLVVAMIGFALSPWLAEGLLRDRARAPLFMLTFGSVIFQAVLEVPLSVLRGTDRPVAYAAATLARTALGFALNITFVVGLRMGVAGMSLSSLTSSATAALIASTVALKYAGLRFDRAVFRAMLRFGWPLIPGALAVISLQHTRSYVLNAYGTLADVGVWALGYRFGALISQVLGGPVRNAWSAQVFALWAAPEGRATFRRVTTLVAALYLWAAAALAALSHEVIAVIAPAGFARSARVIPAVACAFALREVTEFLRVSLFVSQSLRAVAWIEPALALLDIALGVVLVGRYGLTGALVAMPLIFALYAGVMYALARRSLGVEYEVGRVTVLALLALAASAAGITLRTGHLALDILWKLGLVASLPALAVALVFRSPAERDALRALRRRAVGW